MQSDDELLKLRPPIQYGASVNFSTIDTTPGAVSWAAPPQPVDDYTHWLRVQFKHHCAIPQYLFICANRLFLKNIPVEITGPYKAELLAAMKTVIKL